jgi:hypothetical protein
MGAIYRSYKTAQEVLGDPYMTGFADGFDNYAYDYDFLGSEDHTARNRYDLGFEDGAKVWAELVCEGLVRE